MKEEDLRKFIEFTKILLNQTKGKSEFIWFFESFQNQIVNGFFQNSNGELQIDKFKSITEADITRIKAYLRFLDKKALNYGKVFYKEIADKKLKSELIKDFKEMKIAVKNDDIIEFGRRLILQIENIFNFSLDSLNVHNVIAKNPDKYRSIVPKSKNYKGEPWDLYKSFFSFNKVSKIYEPIEISKVPFTSKSTFLYTHFDYEINTWNLNQLYFLRNKGSHRDSLTVNDQKKLDQIIMDFDKNYSFYNKVLFDIVIGIPNIK